MSDIQNVNLFFSIQLFTIRLNAQTLFFFFSSIIMKLTAVTSRTRTEKFRNLTAKSALTCER